MRSRLRCFTPQLCKLIVVWPWRCLFGKLIHVCFSGGAISPPVEPSRISRVDVPRSVASGKMISPRISLISQLKKKEPKPGTATDPPDPRQVLTKGLQLNTHELLAEIGAQGLAATPRLSPGYPMSQLLVPLPLPNDQVIAPPCSVHPVAHRMSACFVGLIPTFFSNGYCMLFPIETMETMETLD